MPKSNLCKNPYADQNLYIRERIEGKIAVKNEPTQKLADKAGINISTFNRIRNNPQRARVQQLRSIFDVLGFSKDDPVRRV